MPSVVPVRGASEVLAAFAAAPQAGEAFDEIFRSVHSAKGARWLQQQLHDATLVEIPDCGHYPMLEAPDAFESALLKFIAA